ncbi:hypothetical protein [Paenibacillus ginsengarvi]|uniref:Uncharacterized protein n=1 Tax=Paenibacillus ginsengarvi TaxID=400777 RepID=A0A3B0BDP9_9BACL|nr:hypothetical protein [Paenibacillus ginsengarvi]RKN70599.1 hypothetical protein D7M11_30490 [Paenibacillus ginsengarvi]
MDKNREGNEGIPTRADRKAKAGIGIAAFALAITLVGCSAGGGEGGANGTEAEGTSVVKNADGGKTVLSSVKEWPKELPADVPRPDGMTVTASVKSETTGTITVAVETSRPFDEIVRLYRDYAEKTGYRQVNEMKDDGYFMYTGSKGAETFSVMIQLDQEGRKKVTGAIVYGKKP